MKRKRFFLTFSYGFLLCFLMTLGCSTPPVLKMSGDLPQIVKDYKHISIYGKSGMVNTGVTLRKGEGYSVLVAEPFYKPYLSEMIGKGNPKFNTGGYYTNAPFSGDLYISLYKGIGGLGAAYDTRWIGVDIIVWDKADFSKITEYFENMKREDPENEAIDAALIYINYYEKLYLAEKQASNEIEQTKKYLQELKGKPKKDNEMVIKTGPKKRLQSTDKLSIEVPQQEEIDQLAAAEKRLNQKLALLEKLKKELSEERNKSQLLTEELEKKEKEKRELQLRIKHGSKRAPFILIASPKNESNVENNIINILGVVDDEEGLSQVEIFVNGKPFKMKKDVRGIKVTGGKIPMRFDFKERIPLEMGINRVKILAVDTDGLASERILTLHRVERQKNIFAVVIGINDYPNVQNLKYAVNDAKAFYDYLTRYNRIPKKNVILLINEDATLSKLRSFLGTYLKNNAGKDDMVIIFFAGHGATEKDVMSPDGDGLEKYLLPYDADPKDLYASALPMREVSYIFNRIQSERLVFIADSCYSGASGGRTIGMTGMRTNLSEAFLDRIASGRGRVIITASGANEVSVENDDLRHGVFTYFLLEGLKGKADADRDGLIRVDEVYRYVSEEVPKATGQEQHPIKKGVVEGRLILGIIE